MTDVIPFSENTELSLPERIAWMAEVMLEFGYLDLKGGFFTIEKNAERYFLTGRFEEYYLRIVPRIGPMRSLGSENGIRYFVIASDTECLFFSLYSHTLKRVELKDMSPKLLIKLKNIKSLEIPQGY